MQPRSGLASKRYRHKVYSALLFVSYDNGKTIAFIVFVLSWRAAAALPMASHRLFRCQHTK